MGGCVDGGGGGEGGGGEGVDVKGGGGGRALMICVMGMKLAFGCWGKNKGWRNGANNEDTAES